MRVLLLNPPGAYCRAGSRWPHRRPPKKTGIDYHPFPFALGYAASRLLADGHELKFLDCIASGISDITLEAIAREFKPDVVFMETRGLEPLTSGLQSYVSLRLSAPGNTNSRRTTTCSKNASQPRPPETPRCVARMDAHVDARDPET